MSRILIKNAVPFLGTVFVGAWGLSVFMEEKIHTKTGKMSESGYIADRMKKAKAAPLNLEAELEVTSA